MLNVNNMRIYELRDYARKVGVKSPTSKTKAELINQIKLIETGEKEPYKTNKGRKPLVSFALDTKNKEFLTLQLDKIKQSTNKSIDSLIKKINS
jgi:hypothetical protein